MTDVVGLRFVTEGYDQVNLQIRDYQRVLKQATDAIAQAARGAESSAAQYLKQVDAYRNSAAALDRLTKMQRDSARAAQETVNQATGVTNAYYSAAEAAKVFGEMLRQQDAVAREWGQGLEARLGVTGQRATELGATFGRLDEVQRNLDTSARGWTESLDRNLGVTGQRATELGATFGRLDEVQRNLGAAAQAWTATLNERLGVSGQRATELGATFARLNEIQRNISAAAQAWTSTLNERLGVSGQRATELGATFGRLAEVQQRLAEGARQWTAQLNERLGVTGQRATQAGASFDALDARVRNAQQGYDQLRASMDPTIAAQQRFAEAERRVTAAVQQGIITREQGSATLAAYRLRLTAVNQTTLVAETAAGRLRQQFLNTANSVAVLDGPLGGIASRFSAFGVLLGRTGIALGAALVGFAALGTVVGRGTRNLMEWEASTARINAILETTGYQAGLTGAAIQQMTSQIALATLESEQGMRAAAARLLTFRDIAGDVFEDVLRSATDMAALGFGTVESEAVKLAKALEDPAQALTSLSRAGIVFTRQQRSVIISLVESGRRAEAMERILDNVRARTEGAAEAAASGTLAGAFDTIGQAVGRATREFAGWILTITGAEAAIHAAAAGLAEYAANAQIPLADRLAEQRQQVRAIEQGMADAAREAAELRTQLEQLASPNLGAAERASLTAALPSIQDRITELEDYSEASLRAAQAILARLEAEDRLVRIRQSLTQIARDEEGLDNLRTEFDLREQLIGLSEDEARVRRMLAQEGLLNLDVAERLARVEARRADLLAQGMAQGEINAVLLEYERNLNRVETTARELVELAERARDARNAITAAADAEGRLERLTAEIAYMEQGLNLEQARAFAAQDVSLRLVEQVLATEKLTAEQRASLQAHMETLNALNEQQAVQDAIVERQREISELADRVQSIDDENALLTEQLRLLDEGVAYADAMRLAEVNLAVARARTLAYTAETTKEKMQQLALVNALLEAEGRNAILVAERDSRRPARGGGGGGAGREVETLDQIIANMQRQIEQEIRLIGLHGEERRALELTFDIQERLRKSGQAYTEEAVANAAREIAAREAVRDQMQQQQSDMERLGQTLERSFTNAFMSIVDGTKSAEDAFKDMARAVIAELFRILVVQQLVGQIRGMFGGGGGGGGFISVSPAANGMVVNNTNVVPFANGGIVGSPTLFPLSGGRTGLMGEAGPEAIMPLKRGRDGKLGVQAEGGGSVIVNNHFHVAANGDESVKRIVAQQVPAIAEATKAAVIDARQRGGKMRAAFR